MLNALLTPFLLATSLFVGVGILDRKTVVLQDIPVPQSVRNAGYPPAVVSSRISDGMAAIEREARTRPEARRLALQADNGPVDLIGDYFHVTPIVRAMQDVTACSTGASAAKSSSAATCSNSARACGARPASRGSSIDLLQKSAESSVFRLGASASLSGPLFRSG